MKAKAKSKGTERMRSAVGIAKEKLAAKSAAEWLEGLRGPVVLPRRKRKR